MTVDDTPADDGSAGDVAADEGSADDTPAEEASASDVLADVDDSDAETFALRRSRELVLAADHFYVTDDDEPTRVAIEDIVEVQYDSFDWFLAVLSVALVGFGLYSTNEHVLGGLGFTAIGAASLYLTYRKRDKLTFKVAGRTKPLVVFPEHSAAVYQALRPVLADDAQVDE